VIGFGGDTSRLIPLYAVGVFLSFTLSQSGMVVHWLRERAKLRKEKEVEPAVVAVAPGGNGLQALPDIELANEEIHRSYFVTDEVTAPGNWKKSLLINALGAVATFIVLCVFIATKFIHGAWIVVVVIPLLVLLFRAIHNHYVMVAEQLSTNGLSPLRPIKHTVIVPISGIHRGVIGALQYAQSIASDRVQAVYVDFEEEATASLKDKWERWGAGIQLVVLPSPYRELTRPLVRYINRVAKENTSEIITVVLPEFIPARWWQQLLHNQTALLIKGQLLFRKNVVVTDVPYHLRH
jgi:hypothetical protein